MTLLIILNIILIIITSVLVAYFIKDKKNVTKNICVDDNECNDEELKNVEHKRIIKEKSERVFTGRFITDDEYQQMKDNRKSDISILLDEVDKEYEHLKELSK